MVRTVDSPRCCATSSTRRLPPFCVSSAFRMAGRCPSNCTSTTAPMTCVIRPLWLAGVAMNLSPSNSKSQAIVDMRLSERLEAGDHLLGDVLRVHEAKLAHRAQVEMFDDLPFELAAELLIALAADTEEFHLLALVHQGKRTLAR